MRMYQVQFVTGFSDGPSEIHQATLARRVLRHYQPAPGLWPTSHLPTRRAEAEARVARRLAESGLTEH
jgi:acyl-CoA dehydrogenase